MQTCEQSRRDPMISRQAHRTQSNSHIRQRAEHQRLADGEAKPPRVECPLLALLVTRSPSLLPNSQGAARSRNSLRPSLQESTRKRDRVSPSPSRRPCDSFSGTLIRRDRRIFVRRNSDARINRSSAGPANGRSSAPRESFTVGEVEGDVATGAFGLRCRGPPRADAESTPAGDRRDDS